MFASQDPRGGSGREFSDETERLIDHAVRDLVGRALDRAVAIITANRALHEKTATLLLQKETLEDEDIATLRSQIASLDAAVAGVDASEKEKPRLASRRP